MHCTTCGRQSSSESVFCEHCGSLLNTAISSDETISAASEPRYEWSALPQSSTLYGYQNQQPAYAPWPQPLYQPIPQPTRTAGSITWSIVLYLWGLVCGAFGLAGGVLQSAPSVVIGLVFIGSLVFGIILLIPLMIFHKRPHFRWWVRLLLIIGVSILSGLIFLLGTALLLHAPQIDEVVFLGIVLSIYGIIVAFLALW